MPIFIFVQNTPFKNPGSVVLRRQLVEKLYFAKFRRELCFDANSACTARARVCPGHSDDRRADARGADPRHQRLPPSTPKDLRRRGTEGAARRNVLRQHRQKRAVVATASARQARRAGRPAGRRSRAGGRPGGQAGKQASEQASRQAGSLILIQNLKI